MRELNSHGVGRSIHEGPTIPQYYDRRFKAPLTEGLVITVEPILSAGSSRVRDGGDGFTLSTADGSLSVHHEHTIVITRGTPDHRHRSSGFRGRLSFWASSKSPEEARAV